MTSDNSGGGTARTVISTLMFSFVEMTVRAVPPPLLSEVTRKYEDIGIAKAAQIARAEGLEVISITNIK